MERKEILAMISLLDDKDNEVVDSVTDNLISRGPGIVPELELAWEGSPDPVVQSKIENLIQEIQYNEVKKDLSGWVKNGCVDLLEGAYYLARFQYPDTSMNKMTEEIERIRKDIWIELNNNLTALEKVKIINYILYKVKGYSRNNEDFYAPNNSFINKVIESRKGNPISLSILYLSVTSKLNLPVYGVNLPKNFILAYKDEYLQDNSGEESDNILFYINPYNNGAVLGRKEIDSFLTQQNLKPHSSFYLPCSNQDIIIRLVNNLIIAYEKSGQTKKTIRMKELLRIVS